MDTDAGQCPDHHGLSPLLFALMPVQTHHANRYQKIQHQGEEENNRTGYTSRQPDVDR